VGRAGKGDGARGAGGVLIGYGPSVDKAFRRETGTPVLIPLNGYSEGAERIKERIEAILAQDPADRSPVNFLMATNWSTNAEDLCRTLKPLEDKGVRFWTPSQALARLPDIRGLARSTVDAAAPPGLCLPVGSVTQYGSPILSAPTLAEISRPMPLPLLVTVESPEEAKPGQTVACVARIDIPVDDLARGFLTERVLPVVEGYGLSSEFAEFAWMKLAASRIRVDLPMPGASEGGDVLPVEASGIEASAAFVDGSLRVTLDSFVSDSRTAHPSIRVSVRFPFRLPAGTTAGPGKIRLGPARVAFDFALTIGIGEEDGPLVGGVKGRMEGTSDPACPACDDYIALQPADRRDALERLRRTIRENLPPGFEETIQYGMIGYVVPHALYPKGYRVDPEQPLPFLALANQKQYIALYHMGLYADAAMQEWFRSSYEALGIGKLDMGKSCIRFRRPDRIPWALVADLCRKLSVEDYIRRVESAR